MQKIDVTLNDEIFGVQPNNKIAVAGFGLMHGFGLATKLQALRLNEKLIAGNIQDQRVLTIRTGNQTATLQFTLYVVPQAAI